MLLLNFHDFGAKRQKLEKLSQNPELFMTSKTVHISLFLSLSLICQHLVIGSIAILILLCVSRSINCFRREIMKIHKCFWLGFSSFLVVRLEIEVSIPISDSLTKNGPVGSFVGKVKFNLTTFRTRGLCVANAAIYQLIYRPNPFFSSPAVRVMARQRNR